MKVSRSLILYTTVAGLFSSACIIRVGVGIQAFYFVMAVNLFFLMLMRRLWLPPGLLALFVFLFFSGAVGILRGTDTPVRFAKEFSGILLSSLYFCSFFRLVSFDVRRCFRLYATAAFWVSLLGIALWPFQWYLLGAYRLRSVFAEPAAFAAVCLPALCYFGYEWFRHRRYGRELLVMLVAFGGAQSSLGFIGIFFGLCVFGAQTRRGRLLIPGVLIVLGLILYTVSRDFALRIDDSLFSLTQSDVTGTNLSTYALFSNLFVMESVISVHPILGNGLGSHGMSYERYVGALPGNDGFSDEGWEGLNAEDGSSLAVRVLSDMGSLGGFLLLLFLWKYRTSGNDERSTISRAVFVYFFVMLLRGGLYFSNEEFFFILTYTLVQSTGTDTEVMTPKEELDTNWGRLLDGGRSMTY